MKIKFRVIGIPKPGGSKTGFYNKKTGRVMIVDACKKVKQWRDSVISASSEAYQKAPLTNPIRLNVTFYMPRPKNHYGTGKKLGVLKPNAPKYHTCKPDHIKLLRSTEDSLTKILWRDDSQIVECNTIKLYADTLPGADICVEELLD